LQLGQALERLLMRLATLSGMTLVWVLTLPRACLDAHPFSVATSGSENHRHWP
jgi:hypothetical protein